MKELSCTQCGHWWKTPIFEDCPNCGSIETQPEESEDYWEQHLEEQGELDKERSIEDKAIGYDRKKAETEYEESKRTKRGY